MTPRPHGGAAAEAPDSSGAGPAVRRRAALAAAVVALAAMAVFAPVRHHEFIDFDDPGYVTDNVHVGRGLSAAGVAWAFTTTAQSNWHPLTWLSHMLDVELFGLRPGPHHLVSVALHALNAALLVIWLAAATGRPWRAAAVGLLFALHPLRIESVAWIAERKDVLASAFGLAALCAWTGHVRRPGIARLALVAVLFALSLLAKPMWVTLPFVLLLLDVWPFGRLAPGPGGGTGTAGWFRRAGRLAVEKAPLFALAAASSAVTVWAQASGGAVAAVTDFPLSRRLANAVASWGAYLARTLWPGELAIFYPYPERISPLSVALSAMTLVALGAAALRLRHARPSLIVGLAWYLGTLVPVIGLVQVGSQALADRYTYLPLIGPVVAVVWLAADLAAGRPRLRAGLAAGVVVLSVALALATRAQLRPWRSSRTLFEQALAVTERNFMAHDFLGVLAAAEGRTGEAIEHHRAALAMQPGLASSHNNLGVLLAEQGRVAEAVEHYRQALASAPGFAEAHNNLGIALARLGRLNEAEGQFRAALDARPDNPEAHQNLGLVLAARGDAAAAVRHYLAALELRPGWSEIALEAAWLLATSPDPAVRDGSRAVELARRAVAGGQGGARALDVLAAALAETGRFDEAEGLASRAAGTARAAGRVGMAGEIEGRRRAYAAGRPWRQRAPASGQGSGSSPAGAS